jgi:hypothetical protein
MSKTRKTRLWGDYKPNNRERAIMMKKCGKKCFLGSKKSFPICSKNTCKVNKKGVHAAYVRAKEYITIKGTKKYSNIAKKALKLLK